MALDKNPTITLMAVVAATMSDHHVATGGHASKKRDYHRDKIFSSYGADISFFRACSSAIGCWSDMVAATAAVRVTVDFWPMP